VPAPSAPPASTLLEARCWSCEGRVLKRVARRNRHLRRLNWSCPHCDVRWAGPGREPQPRAEV
jgi:hypothetical protein